MQRSGAFKSDLEVSDGRFLRQKSRFTDWVTADGSSGYRAEPGRYHLYVGRACPWSQRAMIVRHLKGLEDTIGISFVNPYRDERGWAFEGDGFVDDLHGWDFLSRGLPRQRPELRRSRQRARAVGPRDGPDRQQRLGRRDPDAQQRVGRVGRRRRSTSTPSRCAPRSTRSTSGSTTTSTTASTRPGSRARRTAYDEAFDGVFAALSRLEEILGERRYLTGDTLTEADWRAWVTLLRFDPVYHTHFRLNGRRVMDQPNLWGFTRELYQLPGIAETTAIDEIKTHYYTTHDELNPKRIIPRGPLDWDLTAPHGRG